MMKYILILEHGTRLQENHAVLSNKKIRDIACRNMASRSDLRDEAWPLNTTIEWGETRYAVREFLKKEWKKNNSTEQNLNSTTNESKAKTEADEIILVSCCFQIYIAQ